MTFLPIVERELRVRARSRVNYWARFAVVALGLLVAVPPLFGSAPFAGPIMTGRGAFDGLIVGAFLLCCAACLLTADTISSERREGTLGLLLLTRVRYSDVLAGKLASSGLTCVLSLVAFLPVIMVPLLAGGVTGGEAGRKGLALLNTLFLALCAGLWASTCRRDRFLTGRAAVLVLAELVIGPFVLSKVLQNEEIGLFSPIGTLVEAEDLAYKTSASPYWLSLYLVQAIGWAFLVRALVNLKRGFTDDEAAAESSVVSAIAFRSKLTPAIAAPSSSDPHFRVECRYCGKKNNGQAVFCHECGTELFPKTRPVEPRLPLFTDPTPLHWLLRRQRGPQWALWFAAGLSVFIQFAFFGLPLFTSLVRPRMFFFGFAEIGLATMLVTSSIFAWAASRFFIEARRTGALELLLVTPVGNEKIVSVQWQTLKRSLRGPCLLMVLPGALQSLFLLPMRYIGANSPPSVMAWYFFSVLLPVLDLMAGIGAVCWLGLWFGFRGSQGRTIFWSVLLARALPYVLIRAWSVFLLPPYRVGIRASTWVGFLPWVAQLIYLVWLMRFARLQLLREIAGAAPLNWQRAFLAVRPSPADNLRRVQSWPAG